MGSKPVAVFLHILCLPSCLNFLSDRLIRMHKANKPFPPQAAIGDSLLPQNRKQIRTTEEQADSQTHLHSRQCVLLSVWRSQMIPRIMLSSTPSRSPTKTNCGVTMATLCLCHPLPSSVPDTKRKSQTSFNTVPHEKILEARHVTRDSCGSENSAGTWA